MSEEIKNEEVVVELNQEELEQAILKSGAEEIEKAWDNLAKNFESQEIIEVIVSDVVKGGLVADVGVRGKKVMDS